MLLLALAPLGCGADRPASGEASRAGASGAAAPAAGRGGAPEEALGEALASVLAGRGDAPPPPVPRWPDDLVLHPGARAESIELLGALHDADGAPLSFSRRFDRVGVRGADAVPASGEDFAFDDILRLSAATIAPVADGDTVVRRRDALERVTLGLAEVAPRELRVRDATLALRAAPGGPCALDYALADGEGLALGFRQDGCPRAETLGRLVVATGPTLAVEGRAVVDGRVRAVSGLGWVRRLWGEPPAPGGAVVFDRMLLELDGVGLLDVTRSRRRSGRGPRTTTATRDASALDGGVDWDDAATAAVPAAPPSWTLRVPSLGIDVALAPLVDAPLARDAFPEGRGAAVRAQGSHAGVGFVSLGPAPDAPGAAGARP